MSDLTITADLILGDHGIPSAVTVRGTGAMPQGAVHSIAQETIDSQFGMTTKAHGYKVEMEPTFFEEAEDTVSIWVVFKSQVRS